ncbi:putative disease resistance protein RGA1 [Carica papaya]|uniref:putative disease resistance protein RGA1 n=1 Tax=Carica papaya TaxID=3649 RepID=UPI000B8D13EE|nr:putative disease resistance protein RGA1 [Carica papaya]
MADAIVSTVLEQLVSIGYNEAEQEIRLVVGVKDEVKKLTRNFKTIQDVLEDAEKRWVKEENVRNWLEELKDVSYDLDDVLDEWNTALLKSKVEGEEKKVENSSILKVCSFLPSSCFRINQAIVRHDIAHKITKLNERLDVIANERLRYGFQSGGTETIDLEQQKTTSFIDEFQVCGREESKNRVVSMLLGESSQESPFKESSQESGFQTISIVGMGGLGKTTLAQLAFNDKDVKKHFEKRIWVCVSDPFDEIRIAKAILESIIDSTPNLVELENLLQAIQQSIKNKKFLLVMDDVWNEDSSQWECFQNSLKCGLRGSKILVTTRNKSVANIMGTRSTHMYFLEKLSEEECWSVLSNKAFFDRTDEECEHLEDIGRKIARKCDGLPLAAKFLGGLLQFRRTRDQWQSVLDNQIWELKEAEQKLFPHFQLSYYDLPSEVRQCFLYCAVFPKDYEIDRKKLIRLWMAQGYLKGDDMEIIGQVYFDNLAMRSFFQDFKTDKTGFVCKMHDVVYDFAQYLTKNEFFLINAADNEVYDNELYEKVRHSMILCRSNLSFPVSIHKLKKVRSLLFKNLWGNSETEEQLLDLFGQLTCLRSLDLSWPYYSMNSISKLPKEVGQLIHLRLLDLSWNTRLTELPESICHLYNLQILNIHGCCYLKELPLGMGRLINLRHLYNLRTDRLKFVPKGLGRLTSLCTLKYLVVGGHCNDDEAMTLGDLQQLNNLQGTLHISGLGNVKGIREATNAQLVNKKHLHDLVLRFDGEITDIERIDHLLLQALQPPLDLEILEIRGYKGFTMCPNWLMHLARLRELKLYSFPNIEQLPPLGILPALQVLRIGSMPKVKKVGLEFLGIGTLPSSSSASFPQLQDLTFDFMENWEEWDCEIPPGTVHDNNSSITCTFMVMPRLSSLLIRNCFKLKKLKQPYEDLRKVSLEHLKHDLDASAAALKSEWRRRRWMFK